MRADAKLVCEGEGCSVIFSNVQFKNCFVKVLRGAHVAFLGCSFTDTAECFDDLFVYAADAGSRITITDCTFSSGVGGIAVQDGMFCCCCSLVPTRLNRAQNHQRDSQLKA